MYKLDISVVEQWSTTEDLRYPSSFDLTCPHCGRQANFTTQEPSVNRAKDTVSAMARCARCRHTIRLWFIDDATLYILPPPHQRQPIEGADLMPTAVRQAYQDTIDVFNTGVWSATATQTRRTLEGIVHELLPEEERKGPLAEQLRKLSQSESVNLAQPLITLSNSLRESGNIGAHFDLTRTTDQSTAEAMLDLIDYLIEYIYTLPQMIQELNLRVQQLDREDSEQSNG